MQRVEVGELLDQLHEVLDERFEAGPAPYVIDTMTAEAAGVDEWAAEVVYEDSRAAHDEPTLGAPRHGLRLVALGERTPMAAAWEIYRRLESGVTIDTEPDESGVRWATL